MMGRQRGDQDSLFYVVSRDGLVPGDHLVRRIDAVLDLGWLRGELAPYYSHTGRPSIDPELMIRMLIVGYVFAIRAERQLCSEVQVNMAYRWFCGLGLEDAIPNHSASAASVTNASGAPISCAGCSRRLSKPAWRRTWWAAMRSRSMPV